MKFGFILQVIRNIIYWFLKSNNMKKLSLWLIVWSLIWILGCKKEKFEKVCDCIGNKKDNKKENLIAANNEFYWKFEGFGYTKNGKKVLKTYAIEDYFSVYFDNDKVYIPSKLNFSYTIYTSNYNISNVNRMKVIEGFRGIADIYIEAIFKRLDTCKCFGIEGDKLYIYYEAPEIDTEYNLLIFQKVNR